MAESNVILNMWDTVENFPDTIYPIIIRIFGGGESSFQTQELKHALGNLDIHPSLYKVEILTCDMVNVFHLSLKEVIDWLLSSHIHFISAHLHQGISLEILTSQSKSWDLQFYYEQMNRLRFHPGFPNGNSLECPVLLQDKFAYLVHLNTVGICIKTYKFNRSASETEFYAQLIALQT